jgi:hypothetical protein
MESMNLGYSMHRDVIATETIFNQSMEFIVRYMVITLTDIYSINSTDELQELNPSN